MAVSKHLLLAILQIWALFLMTLVHAQQQLGFISIDCGTSESSYTDEQSGITYLSDTNFVESGENREISPVFKAQTDEKQFWNVRSFPEGTKNCYTLEPSGNKGTRYLIRARFMYGNYDNKNKFPVFDLYIGVDLWQRVIINNATDKFDTEILHVPSSDQIQVCLVNTNFGTPFISVLELRPLESTAYPSEIATLLLYVPFDFGAASNKIMRYKDDPYDRLWSSLSSPVWIPLNISSEETSITKDVYEEPFTVMSTASTKDRNATFMSIQWGQQNKSTEYYFVMYFAELEKLDTNQTRAFNVYINGFLSYGPVVPKYLQSLSLHTVLPGTPDEEGTLKISLNKTENSTLPPLINALEVLLYKDSSGQETYGTDISGILGIKTDYGLNIENWQGDPCLPKAWDHLNCTFNNNLPPRITSLNLSSIGLKGEISPSFAKITMLQYLDLSNNSLSGTVPEFFADMTFLTVLNLKGNKLEGPLPPKLLERTKDGLSLSVDDDVMPITPSNGTSSSEGFLYGDNKFVVAIVASFSGVFINLVL